MATRTEIFELSNYLADMIEREIDTLVGSHGLVNAQGCNDLARVFAAHWLAKLCAGMSEENSREVFNRFCFEYRDQERILRRNAGE